MTTKYKIKFYEIETNEDLDCCIEDLVDCGATDCWSKLDTDSETGTVRFNTANYQNFYNKFRLTDSYDLMESIV